MHKLKGRFLVLAIIAVVALAGCDWIIDGNPYEIAVQQPRRGDTLIVGEPFRVQARVESDNPVTSSWVAIYHNFVGPNQDPGSDKDTVFTAPLDVAPGTRRFRVDTMLAIPALEEAPGSDFTLLVQIQWEGGGAGRGKKVAILDPDSQDAGRRE